MEIDIKYMKPYKIKVKSDNNIEKIEGVVIPDKMWFFYFRKYKHIKGFNIRILGVHINIKEDNAINKLIKMVL